MITGSPANGTVVLTKPTYYFTIKVETLRDFMKASEDIATAFELSISEHLRSKLVAQS